MGPHPIEMLSSEPPITLLHLRQFTGDDEAFLSRIPPETSGVYAWYQAFVFRQNTDEFCEDLLNSILTKKFADRSNTIGPTHRVTLSSDPSITNSKKELLLRVIKEPGFREHLNAALALNVYLQSPLYIGRATNLRVRIAQHLREGSPLKTRLASIQVDLRSSSLLYMPLPKISQEVKTENMDGDWDVLFEDIFSRLFEPRFTIRY